MKIKDTIIFPRDKKSELWRQISQLEAYPHWNPIIKKASGELAFESMLDIKLALPGSISKSVIAKITGYSEGKYLSFSIPSFLGKWWFQAEFIFRVFPNKDGNLELITEIYCYGLQVRFFRSNVKFKYKQVAETINQAIKRQIDSD